jgi:arylsulfatase A-like enzyme
VLSIEGPEGQPEGSPLTDVELAHLYDHYDGCLRYGDLWLELLLGALERRGLLDHALVIVTADHGEDLLEHGRVNHRSSLHDSVVHVPLVIAGPGFAAGTRRGELVEQRDLVPTLLQAAGAELPAGLQGRPLQVPQQRELVYAEGVQGALLVRGPRQALIAHGLDLSAPELPDSLARAPLQAPAFSYYDLAADPGQQRDLLLNPAPGDQAAAEALRQALVAWRRQLQTGTHRLPQAEVDPEVARQMQEQGYWSPTPSPP